MKPILFFLFMFLFASCSFKLSSESSGPQPFKAIYLVQENGELTNEDLKAHPEVFVTGSFEDFKSHAEEKAALWIDKNAVQLVDQKWLHEDPQKYYPLVLVGYNDPLYSFRDVFDGFGIEGPYVDWSKEKLEPGFSVWMLQENKEGSQRAVFRGYEEVPTVKRILEVMDEVTQSLPFKTPSSYRANSSSKACACA